MARMKKYRSPSGGTVSARGNRVWALVLLVLAIGYLYPIFLVLLNSLKKKAFITRDTFRLPDAQSFFGIKNYINGIEKTEFFSAFGCSLFITVASVVVIVICTSMCAWFLVRVNNRFTKFIYLLCLFSMVVPFQMVMFTLSKVANTLNLGNPVGIVFVYLGFGAGLSVFMFCGFVKSIPIEIEEAAMLDGCSPLQIFFYVVFPIMKPTTITVAILQAMWIWNDYLLPYLVLDINKYKTIPIAVQYLKGGYGSVDWGTMMAVLVMSIVPIIVFYAFGQRYIIKGVISGAIKG